MPLSVAHVSSAAIVDGEALWFVYILFFSNHFTSFRSPSVAWTDIMAQVLPVT